LEGAGGAPTPHIPPGRHTIQPDPEVPARVSTTTSPKLELRSDPLHPMPEDDVLVIEEEEVPRIGAVLERKLPYASQALPALALGRAP
jgi:hypothetical protein